MEFKSPVYHVIAVPIDKIKTNTYNPNRVAPLRLKQITGLAALFKDVKFGKAWRPVEEDAER